MTLSIRITEEPSEHGTIRTIEVETSTEDISDPASFVGDVLHFAGGGTVVVREKPEPAPAPRTGPPMLDQNIGHPADLCARATCGHPMTGHGSITGDGKARPSGSGQCHQCGPEVCWSYVAPMNRPITPVGERVTQAGPMAVVALGVANPGRTR